MSLLHQCVFAKAEKRADDSSSSKEGVRATGGGNCSGGSGGEPLSTDGCGGVRCSRRRRASTLSYILDRTIEWREVPPRGRLGGEPDMAMPSVLWLRVDRPLPAE